MADEEWEDVEVNNLSSGQTSDDEWETVPSSELTTYSQNSDRFISNPSVMKTDAINFGASTQLDKKPKENYFAMTEIPKGFAKGLGNFIVGLPKTAGIAYEEVGELAQTVDAKGLELFTIGGLVKKGIRTYADKTQVDEQLIQSGKDIVRNTNIALEKLGLSRPETKAGKVAFDVGGAMGSLVTSLGIAAVTGNPLLSAGFFGSLQQTEGYKESREAGKTPSAALKIGTAMGFMEGALEFVGLHMWTESLKTSTRIGRVVQRTASEFIQEGSQQLSEETISKVTGIRDVEMEEILKNTFYSATIGAMVGGGTSVIAEFSPNSPIKQLEANGLTKEQAVEVVDAYVEQNSKEIQNETNKLYENVADPISISDKRLQEFEKEVDAFVEGKVSEETQAVISEKEAVEKTVEEKPLIEEAKKFDSIDKFVESFPVEKITKTGEPVSLKSFHGTDKEFDKFEIQKEGVRYSGDGIYFTPSDYHAEQFAGENGRVIESFLELKNPYVSYLPEGNMNFQYGSDFINEIKAKGHDSLIVRIKDTDSITGVVEDDWINEIVVFDLNTIKTKEQLIEIYNKAKKVDSVELTGNEKISLKKALEREEKASRKAYKKAVKDTRTSIKELQESAIAVIDSSKLSLKEKGKFLKTIKNIQTKAQFSKSNLVERIDALVEVQEKNIVKSQIKKEMKTTKALKKGVKRIERFDYETVKTIKEIRKIDKLTKEQALKELDLMGDLETESEKIKARFLSLKANGTNSSLELYNQVLSDIKAIKEAGKEAKSEEDLMAKIERTENKIELKEAIDKVKADKAKVKTTVGNFYRRGFGNIYSLLNSIAGKKIAEKYDTELSENNKQTALFFKNKQILNDAANIYGLKNSNAFAKQFQEYLKETFEVKDVEGSTYNFDKFEIMDIYLSIKNDTVKERYYNAYGEGQISQAISNLNSADIQFADYMQAEVQSYYDVYNKKHIEVFGRDLGRVDNYFPATTEKESEIFDDYRAKGNLPSAVKERTKSTKVFPKPKNAFEKMNKHIHQGEHLRHLSTEYTDLINLFSDRKIKKDIVDKYGQGVYNTLITQIEQLSLNKEMQKMDFTSSLFQKLMNNWVAAKITLNPNIFIKQLVSAGNYVENMPATTWAKQFTKGVFSPKETFDFMWKNADFLEARYNKGYNEAVTDVMEGVHKLQPKKNSWATSLTGLARAGDMTAIVYGGYPLIKYRMSQGVSKEKAFEEFEKITLKAQQSNLASGLSELQNANNPFAKPFLAFKNTANQYLRKQVDAIFAYRNGDIELDQLIKTLAIYAIIQPALYAFSGVALKHAFSLFRNLDDLPEEAFDSIMTQLAVNPFQAILLIDDLSTAAVRKLKGDKLYNALSSPLVDDLNRAAQKMNKKEKGAIDYLEILAPLIEISTGVPVKTPTRIFERITGRK